MKKLFAALSVLAALMMAAPVHAFDLNVKKKSCETACDATYNECVR